MAGGCAVSGLRGAVADYLTVRRTLGFQLAGAGLLLEQFVDFADAADTDTITTQLAVQCRCRCAVTTTPDRCPARRTIADTALPDSSPRGAISVVNTCAQAHRGRPRRSQPATACPTSADNGSRSSRWALPRTKISP